MTNENDEKENQVIREALSKAQVFAYPRVVVAVKELIEQARADERAKTEIWTGTKYELLSKVTNEAYANGVAAERQRAAVALKEEHKKGYDEGLADGQGKGTPHTMANEKCSKCWNDGHKKGYAKGQADERYMMEQTCKKHTADAFQKGIDAVRKELFSAVIVGDKDRNGVHLVYITAERIKEAISASRKKVSK